MEVEAGYTHVPMKSSGRLGRAAHMVFLLPELACPCISREGPSLLFSSHNPRVLLASGHHTATEFSLQRCLGLEPQPGGE